MDTKLKEDTVGRVERMLPDKENIKSTEIEYSGLCSTCMYAPDCFNLMRSKDAILFCEEFDIYPDPGLQINSESLSKNCPVSNEDNDHKYIGLCINCEHRETCTTPVSEGGVWHCEEYE